MKAGKQSTKLTKCTKKVYFCRFTSFPTSRWERKVMDTRFIKRLISRIGFSSQAVAYVPNQRLGTRFKAHEVHEESVFLQIYLVPNVPLGTQGYGHPFHQTANFPNRFFIPSIAYVPNQRLGTRFKAHEVHEESVFLQIYLVHYVPLGAR